MESAVGERADSIFSVMRTPYRTAATLVFLCLATSLIASDKTDLSVVAALAAQKKWTEAANQIQPYRQDHKESVEAALLQAEIWIHLGLLSDADSILQHILAVHPHSIEALSASAELSRTLGDKTTAETILLRCTRYAPHSAEVWERLGTFYLELARKEALSAFQRAAMLAPKDPLVRANIATAHHQQGEEAQAELDFRRALQLNALPAKPDSTVDYLYAEFLQDRAQYQQSIAEYDRALQRDPEMLDAHLGRARSLARLQQWARAESDLLLCLNDEDKQIAALNLLTKVAQGEGKTEDAQRYAEQAAELSSTAVADKAKNNQIASLLQNAHSLLLHKHFAEAAESYQQLLHDHANVAEAWLHLGQCHAELGQLDAAQSDIRHYLSMENESAIGHVLLGRVLLRQAQVNAARDEFLHAEKIDPLLLDAHLGVAASYMMESNFPHAIRILRTIAVSSTASSESQLMLTEALYKNHQLAEALHEIDRLLQRDPSNKAAIQMKAALRDKRTQP